jgi:hypothetical protein
MKLARSVRRGLLAAMEDAGVRRLRATLVTTVRDADGKRAVRRAVVLKR